MCVPTTMRVWRNECWNTYKVLVSVSHLYLGLLACAYTNNTRNTSRNVQMYLTRNVSILHSNQLNMKRELQKYWCVYTIDLFWTVGIKNRTNRQTVILSHSKLKHFAQFLCIDFSFGEYVASQGSLIKVYVVKKIIYINKFGWPGFVCSVWSLCYFCSRLVHRK